MNTYVALRQHLLRRLLRVTLGITVLCLLATGCEQDLLATVPDAGRPACGTVLFLNRAPVTITRSGEADSLDDTSPLVGQFEPFVNSFTTSGATISTEDWDELVECVASYLLPYDIAVVTEPPNPADHLEIYLVDEPGEVGEFEAVVVATGTHCEWNPRRNGFVFLERYYDAASGDIDPLCRLTAYAFGKIATLDLVTDCDDLMSGFGGDAKCTPSFLDRDIPCTGVACQCGGVTQNSHQSLLGRFGPRVCEATP